jgi:hypothetical protein
MKIKETVERECCQDKDLLPYLGIFRSLEDEDYAKLHDIKFCKYCGQIWECSNLRGKERIPLNLFDV